MKIAKYITLIAIAVTLLASCSEYSRKQRKVYMPDMAYSRAYEFYSNNPNYADGITAQAPVKGTMARGSSSPYYIAELDTNAAKANKYNGSFTLADVAEGGRVYNIHCAVCHGNNLDGNGPLYNGGNGKYPAAPANFKDAKYLNMPIGTMYHAIMYGKNLMGAYASQLDVKQRWQILAYIKSIQAENGGSPLTSSFSIGDAPLTVAVETGKEANKAEEPKKEESKKEEPKKEDKKK
jgi:mono/diheme cytochrome c family protein